MALPADLQERFHTFESLNLTKLNEARGARGTIDRKERAFEYPKLLNAASLVKDKPEFAALAAATQNPFAVGVNRHLNRLPELPGNAPSQRIMFVGPGPAGTRDLIATAAYLNSHGILLDKNMAHIVDATGGPLREAMQGESGPQDGVTHGGALDVLNLRYDGTVLEGAALKAAVDSGKLHLGRFDKPANYGDPTSGSNPNYWFYMTAFDPSSITWGGDNGALPQLKEFQGWTNSTQLWRVIDLITVGFSSQYPVPEQTNYKNNPVELTDASKLPPMLDLMAKAADASDPAGAAEAREKLRWFSEYCEEGKTATRVMGLNAPMTQASVDAGMLSSRALAIFQNLERVWKSAYTDANGRFNDVAAYENPALGYQKLREQNLISDEALGALTSTGFVNKPFILPPSDLKPWMKFRPVGVEGTPGKDGYGLPYKPLSVVGLARVFLQSNLPREEVAAGYQESLLKVFNGTDEAAKAQLGALLQAKHLPVSAEGITAFANVAAAETQAGTLNELKETLFEKVRYNKLVAAAGETSDGTPEHQARINRAKDDVKKVDGFWDEALALVRDPALAQGEKGAVALQEKLRELDDRMRDLKVMIDGKEERIIAFTAPHMVPHAARRMPGIDVVGMHHVGIGVSNTFLAP